MSLYNYTIRINSKDTRKIFNEVISSYQNENYRSAINSLYSTVLYDLIYKLKYLSNFYDDSTAENILDKVENKQKENSTNSSWELNLIDDVYKRTQIIDNSLYADIISLKRYRNLCSHPSLVDKKLTLPSPNPEIVSGLMNSILVKLFNKAPNLISNITDNFTNDISDKKEKLLLDSKFRLNYLKNFYLNNLEIEQEEKLLDNLFKFIFIKTGTPFDENREVNYLVFIDIIKTNEETFMKYLENIKCKDLLFKDESGILKKYFSRFIAEFPEFIHHIKEYALNDIINYSRENFIDWLLNPELFNLNLKDTISAVVQVFEYKHDSFYENNCESIYEPFKNLVKKCDLKFDIDDVIQYKFSKDELNLIKMKSEILGGKDLFINFIIDMYLNSYNYAQAQQRLIYIKMYINYMNEEKYLLKLLNGANNNSQIYGEFNSAPYIRSVVFKKFINYKNKNDIPKYKDTFSNLEIE
ncbi:hypothetical protein DY120_00670 [Apilactobacillus micheneri]|uniref:Uncharacterized protein n=1 Tax=Apilactobacillus micheneri TaxID=1899430 RepID=A0ABY2YY47_9LACO|nr:hypothetical protein [Apilactobacillus micheneri]TPR26243.1 hypothetical protein DY114_00670 [Apilactobacillus micheneri]TPR26997.1 hypothetical protein DY111_00670 [Apilactobacillus micheneri]TPR27855.1 hypothetical protein DY113_04445 [Apilactobacillus micheneri]TPR31760.1 hypothetical protein DY117_00670 [Apilactobacillus micheneri]TPR32164.1 hypothetical protein DY120_00670 [Apilactobacillus micheneri]